MDGLETARKSSTRKLFQHRVTKWPHFGPRLAGDLCKITLAGRGEKPDISLTSQTQRVNKFLGVPE